MHLTGQPEDVLFIRSESCRKDETYEYIRRIHGYPDHGVFDRRYSQLYT